MSKQPNAMVTSTSNDQLDLLDVSHFDQFNLFDGHGLSGDDMPPINEREDDTSTIASVATATTNITISRRMNNPPTITSIYEPKFLEIFIAYRQFAQSYEPNIDLVNLSSQHLMTLCLNNLLPFSNWARDSATATYIRNTLYDHADMRPEVRNGLALIIVYTFSAAKASDELDNYKQQFSNINSLNTSSKVSNIDMFSILMRSDTGMGIVNKTSLKIYNDPLEYLSFIKSCISGLIDAVAIPENERQNIPQSKKSRRGSRNKDEVEAFHYLKTALIAMFQHPESYKAAQMKIKQVVAFWNDKGNTIRNERFSALYNLNTPGNTPTQSARNSGNNHNIVISDSDSNRANSGSNSNSNISLNYQYSGPVSQGNSAANSAHNSGVGVGSFPGINTLQISRTSGRSSTNSLNVEHRYSNGSGGHMPEGRDVRQLSNNSVGSQQYFNIYDDGNSGEADNVSTSSRSPYASQNNSFYNSGSSAGPGPYAQVPRARSTGDSSPLMYNQSVPNMLMNPNGGRPSGGPGSATFSRASAMTNISVPVPPSGGGPFGGASSSSGYYGPNSPLAAPQVIPNTIPSVAVPSIRYDRTGTAHWVASNTLLYDLDALHSSLLCQSSGTYYLVDESKLAAYLEEASGGVRGQESSITAKDISLNQFMVQSGATTLEKVLQKSGGLITSWSGRDFSQFKTFVESWKQIQIQHQLSELQKAGEPSQQRSRNQSYVSTDSSAPSRSGSILGPMVDFSNSITGKRPTRRRTTGEMNNARELAAQAVQLEAEVMAAQQRGSISIHPDMFQYDNMMPPPAAVPASAAQPKTGLSSLFGSVTMEESPPPSSSSATTPPPPPAEPVLPPLSPSVTRPSAGPMSLLAYWNSLAAAQSCSGAFGHASDASVVRPGRGVIVYERSMEVGLILRANPRLQIYEDAWCLYYPEDVQYTPPPQGQPESDPSSSFAALLVHLLPQSHPLMSYIQAPQQHTFQSPVMMNDDEMSNKDSEDNELPGSGSSGARRSRQNSNDLRRSLPMGGFGGQASPLGPQRYTVSYFSHKSDHQPYVVMDNNISTEAPQAPPQNKYRTLGTLDNQFHVITSKFSEGSYFHDIIIR